MVTNLPTNVDATYIDDPTDPSKKLHQQIHDIIHNALNALSDPTATDTYTARASITAAVAAHVAAIDPHGTQAYTDNQLKNYTANSGLASVATSGDALDVVGAELVFFFNAASGRYDYNGNALRSVAALTASGHPKVFYGPSGQHPRNITTATGPSGAAVSVTPVFHKYDEYRIRL